MNLDRFLDRVPEIEQEREYWFVRTDNGYYYDIFTEHEFIAIAWNEITVEDIRNSLQNEEALRRKIVQQSRRDEERDARSENREVDESNILNPLNPRHKSKISTIVRKVQNFYKLKQGDVVVIPNYRSSKVRFGVITDRAIFVKNNGENDCDFRKRRKVKWVKERSFLDMGAAFYMFKKNMHTISRLNNEIISLIDIEMNDVYFKGGYGHFVIRVRKEQDVKAAALFGLGADLLHLINRINDIYEFDEDVENTLTKVRVQSQGNIVFKGPVGNAIVALSLLFISISCGGPPNDVEVRLRNAGEGARIDNIKTMLDALEVEVNSRPL